MDTTDPNAQGQDTNVVPVLDTQTPEAALEAKVFRGVQARIDELTANWRQTQEQLAKSNEQNNALMLSLANRSNASNEPEVDPAVDLDPALKAVLDAQAQRFEAQLNKLTATFNQSMNRMQLNQVANGEDPKIVGRAAEIMSQYNMSHEAALTVAYGEAARAERANAGKNANARTNFNALGSTVLTGRREENVAPIQDAAATPLPDNFDNLSPQQQIAILEKRGVAKRQW